MVLVVGLVYYNYDVTNINLFVQNLQEILQSFQELKALLDCACLNKKQRGLVDDGWEDVVSLATALGDKLKCIAKRSESEEGTPDEIWRRKLLILWISMTFAHREHLHFRQKPILLFPEAERNALLHCTRVKIFSFIFKPQKVFRMEPCKVCYVVFVRFLKK